MVRDAQRYSGAFVYRLLETIFPLFFIPLEPYPPLRGTFPTRGRLCVRDTASPIQPPPLQGTSFHRKEGASTRAPSLGRGCRAQRGGVGFLFCSEAASSLPSPSGKGDRVAVDRVLSLTAHLRRSSPLSFIPLLPYPPLRGAFPSRGRLWCGNTAILTSSA